MHKIKKGDLVKVITGKDKDKTGKVLSVNVKKNTVLVIRLANYYDISVDYLVGRTDKKEMNK